MTSGSMAAERSGHTEDAIDDAGRTACCAPVGDAGDMAVDAAPETRP